MKAIRRKAPGNMRMMPRFLSRSKKSLMEKDFDRGLAIIGDMLFERLKKIKGMDWFSTHPLSL
jgi:hypothetical protein